MKEENMRTITVFFLSAILLMNIHLLRGASSIPLGKTVDDPGKYSIPGYRVVFNAKGNLNGDGIDDYVNVYNVEKDDPEKYGKEKRILVIFASKPGKGYLIAAYSENVVFPYGYDGNFPDSLSDIIIENGVLKVEQYGGFATRWGREAVFKYDGSTGAILFIRDSIEYFRSDEPEKITDGGVVDSRMSGMRTIQEYDIFRIRK